MARQRILSHFFFFSPPTHFVGPEHVHTYHEWMKDPDLLEATGSEPLSYDEEIDSESAEDLEDPNHAIYAL